MEDRLAELPRGWLWTTVGEISKDIHYGYTESSSEKQIGPKFLRITDIQNNSVNWESVPYCKIEEFEKGKYLLKDGDLVFARTGATVGKSFLIRGNIPEAVFASYLIRIILDKNIDRVFISNFFQSNYYWSQIQKGKLGIGQPNVNAQILSHITIPLPPLPEQHRIVAKIEELFTKLEAGVEALKKIKAQLKRYRQTVLKYAFEGKLTNRNMVEGQLPDGWKWKQINEITSVLGDGLHGTPLYSESGEYYFINGNNLSDGKIEIKENTKRVTIEEYEKYKKPLNGNTIFVSINGTLGNTAFYNGEKVILGKSACYFNVLNTVDKQYVRYCITSQRFINYAYKYATGSTIKNVGLKAMREFEIPLPPTIEEQNIIVNEIESRLSVCDKIEESNQQSLKQSERLRQSILKRAFEGKLVPQDSTDEPADKLLDRIKEEKAKRAVENKREKKHRNKKSKQMELI